MADNRAMEEVLEFIWSQREEGVNSIEKLFCIDEVAGSGADKNTLGQMEELGLLRVHGDSIELSAEGEKLAEAAIRRHRLAERLLTEVLALDEESVEKNACSFEHTLTPEVTDSICSLLGHPPTCPHGLPIPRGNCCTKTAGDLKPLVNPLDALSVGESGKIIFIATNSHARLDKLSTLGIVPGSTVLLHQKRPAFVIMIGETTLALDPLIIKDIYVKRLPKKN